VGRNTNATEDSIAAKVELSVQRSDIASSLQEIFFRPPIVLLQLLPKFPQVVGVQRWVRVRCESIIDQFCASSKHRWSIRLWKVMDYKIDLVVRMAKSAEKTGKLALSSGLGGSKRTDEPAVLGSYSKPISRMT
jgi:hypothetical protein